MACVVYVKDNDVDKALRKFKKKVERCGVLKECKHRKYFIKPSVERRYKAMASLKKKRFYSTRSSILNFSMIFV